MVLIRGHAGNWGKYIACGGLVVIFVLGPSATSMCEDQGRSNTHQKQYSPVAPPQELRTSSPGDAGLDYANACNSPKPTDDANFCIQRESLKAYQKQATWAEATFFIGVLGTFAVLATLRWTIRAVSVSERNATAAELALEETSRALRHAQATAERDLRPWLTVEAMLDSPITISPIARGVSDAPPGHDHFHFFVKVTARNVGRSAAQNVVYWVRAANFTLDDAPMKWFCLEIEEVKHAIRRRTRGSYGDSTPPREVFSDSLAPSELYIGRRWCHFSALPDDARSIENTFQLCVFVAAAYTVAGGTDVFYTAKLFPVGYHTEVPEFTPFIRKDGIPVGTGEVALGPVRKGVTT